MTADHGGECSGLAERLVSEASEKGLDLVGPGGVLTGLTKRVREAGLEADLAGSLLIAEGDQTVAVRSVAGDEFTAWIAARLVWPWRAARTACRRRS